ncbi:unnamed protein product [Chilo suppressalis]|uniref:THAP-type domain-containing protein n=1 Tax=Chilo suppressalis TaxID=168631 RepID=A0ABN8L939_CHISP|nr:unnamed protein product [Chilo suppressalis]
MVKYCIVRGCASGLASDRKNRLKNNLRQSSLFKVPKSNVLREKWAKALSQQLTSNQFVCEKHFREEDIKKADRLIINGAETIIVRERWTLLNDNVIPINLQDLEMEIFEKVAAHIHHEKKMTLIASTSKDVSPEPLLFCRGCLVTGVRLFDLQSTELKTTFEEFVGKTRVGQAGYWLCACCAMLLDKFTQFRDRCRRAERAMWNLCNHNELNAHTVKSIDRTYHKLNLNLAISKPTYIGTDTILVDYEDKASRKRKHMEYEEEEEIKMKEDKQNLDEKEDVKLEKGEHIPSIPLGEERHINLKEGEDIIIKEEAYVKLEQEDHMQLEEGGHIQYKDGKRFDVEEEERIIIDVDRPVKLEEEEQIQFEEEGHVHSEEEEDITIKEEDYITIEEEVPVNFDAGDGA